MHSLVMFAKLYPYIAFSFALAFLQLGIYFRRKCIGWQYPCLGIGAILMATAACWLIFRGDLNAEKWARSVAAVLGV